jgi:hypothetical protein
VVNSNVSEKLIAKCEQLIAEHEVRVSEEERTMPVEGRSLQDRRRIKTGTNNSNGEFDPGSG